MALQAIHEDENLVAATARANRPEPHCCLFRINHLGWVFEGAGSAFRSRLTRTAKALSKERWH